MSYIVEEIAHPRIEDCQIQVLEKTKDEASYGSGAIIDLEVPFIHSYTPEELRNLGSWLVQQAERISREYTKTGKRKKQEQS